MYVYVMLDWKLRSVSACKFATSYENLVATFKVLVLHRETEHLISNKNKGTVIDPCR